jgi:hypothetical protein
MKIVNRQKFLDLPPGTFFSEGRQWYFETLKIKGDTFHGGTGDFGELDPAWVASETGPDAFDRLNEMLANGSSYPMEDAMGRNGMFEADALYLVFEKADLLQLREMIDEAVAVSPS